jgi:hypothetical protein
LARRLDVRRQVSKGLVSGVQQLQRGIPVVRAAELAEAVVRQEVGVRRVVDVLFELGVEYLEALFDEVDCLAFFLDSDRSSR